MEFYSTVSSLRVDPQKNFKIVYTINVLSEVGPCLEVYAVQLNQNDNLSLTYQRLYTHTCSAFEAQLDEQDLSIIKLTSEYSLGEITKKFSRKSDLKPHEFFAKHVDEAFEKTHLRPYVESRVAKALRMLGDKCVYLKGKSGNPAHKEISICKDEVSVFFHFNRGPEGTKYYPTIRVAGESLVLVGKEPTMVTQNPCNLLIDNILYFFGPDIDGKKLEPFFRKYNIDIPKDKEPEYYKKFISQIIERYTVIAKGFEIKSQTAEPIAELRLEENWNEQVMLILYFDYLREKIQAAEKKSVYVKLDTINGQFQYTRIMRDWSFEEKVKSGLEKLGLVNIVGSCYALRKQQGKGDLLSFINWINSHSAQLAELGVQVRQGDKERKYFTGHIGIDIDIEEGNDWFDIKAVVQFGQFKIPFIQLKRHLLEMIRTFTLPDGSIAVIPEEWFAKYKDLAGLVEQGEGETLGLKRHHYALVDDLMLNQQVASQLPDKSVYTSYEKLHEINEVQIPKEFDGVLRPYQIEGFNWLHFLKRNSFGGCLADDMGLGKTIQTLAMLESAKLEPKEEVLVVEDRGQLALFNPHQNTAIYVTSKTPSLIVMPTSLIHNWEHEVKKWVPHLSVLVYIGLGRETLLPDFNRYDLVLTTYGTVRNDIELLKKMEFYYLILDESQVIKNPGAKVTKAIRKLKAENRLALSGTPIENSLTDLWSQMSFLNPGLLGSYDYFKEEFAIPIEKRGDEERKQKLKVLIQPFLLRRSKEEVAKDLPQLTEKEYFSEMSTEQQKLYDDTKNYYRRKILEDIEGIGEVKSQFLILKGLMQLRQIANHPKLVNKEYEGESGKFTDIMATIHSLLSKNRRILVFSQFVKHLDLIAAELQKSEIVFSMLTGQSRNREELITTWRREERGVFLISLKAGGVGLNLTEADYVLICDPWWNPAAEKQAINRAHRIGQDKPVFAYKFISKGTVEEKILQLQERKRKLSHDLLGEGQGMDWVINKEDIELLFG